MSTYFIKRKGWRYDYTLNGQRYTGAWFETKRKAREAEAESRKEVKDSKGGNQIPTDMDFLELVNRRLDYVKAYNSPQHYAEHRSRAKRWIQLWGNKKCREISADDIQAFLLQRSQVSPHTANKELVRLRATFNYGKKKGRIDVNPTEGIEFFPEERKLQYVPTLDVVERVIAVADPETQDYLWTIRDTLGRMSEINRLIWKDVDLESRFLVLYTRKKKGGHLTPRKVPLSQRLYGILRRRFEESDPNKPWVFWHTYWSSKTGEKCEGPYKVRKRIMKTLCREAGVPYFRFYALRHSGASTLDDHNVPIGAIQRILGHESRTTTEIYLHSIRDTEREAIAIFDG